MPADPHLSDVLDSVADGVAVDWNEIDSHPTDADTRGLLEELRVVAAVARFHGAHAERDEHDDGADRTHTDDVAPPAEEREIRRWGRYDLVEKLGRGTYGTVYRAWDSDLE